MGYWKDFRLLLWKIVLLQKRKPLSSLLEVLLPATFILILVVLRVCSNKQIQHEKYVWEPFKVDDKVPVIEDIIKRKHKGLWNLAYYPNTSYHRELMKRVESMYTLSLL